MEKRFVSIWFRFLETDWFCRRQPTLKAIPFVFTELQHGRKVVTAANSLAYQEGITIGSTVADAKAKVPQLQAFDSIPELSVRLLTAIGHWCDRYTPVVAVDGTDGLLMDVTGCAHLWGGEASYLSAITKRLMELGYYVRAAIADTAGTAWAMARYGKAEIVAPNEQSAALIELPPAALRLSSIVLERLTKLGFRKISGFIKMQRSMLRRRFGPELLARLDQALGVVSEVLIPLVQPAEYRERLPCTEPICNRAGIEIAIQHLLEKLCGRMQKEGKGVRSAILRGIRVDGKIVEISIATVLPSVNVQHLAKLFEIKIANFAPGLGIELFSLEATHIEDIDAHQENLFEITGDLADKDLAELVDRISSKLNGVQIRRYLPSEHYWPEHAVTATNSLTDNPSSAWPDKYRPIELLRKPELIIVSAPIPDHPPMLFTYKGKLHRIKKADGPERFERAWWMEDGMPRDYYRVEDENGCRYWVFRSGNYGDTQPPSWFLHGFFA